MPVALTIPVKALHKAKSRLALPDDGRARTALQLLHHTLGVATTSESVALVVVVSDDPVVARAAQHFGALVVPEPPRPGLVHAADAGRDSCRAMAPGHDLAVMVSDLPSLTHGDLDEVFVQFRSARAAVLVADHHGTGTTMLVHPGTISPPILFGAGSARRHVAAGYRPATGSLFGLRHDLDSIEDLLAHPAWRPQLLSQSDTA